MMPVFKSGVGLAPAWCELEFFEIVTLTVGTTYSFERVSSKEKLIVGEGICRIGYADTIMLAEERTNLDLQDGHFEVLEVVSDAILIRICGRWGEIVGGSGIGTVSKSDSPHDQGDPVDYLKETNFDNHYHDGDECWIVFKGSGEVVSEGKCYEVSSGDCVATGMGHHHDFPRVYAPVKAVYFEMTLEGQKRRGHLWEHTHGLAQPKWDRV